MTNINRLSIRNFRSIGSNGIEIELGNRLTILIGPNNSGKSNILQSIKLLLSSKIIPYNRTEIKFSEFDIPMSSTGSTELIVYCTPRESDIDRISNNLLKTVFPIISHSEDTTKIGTIRDYIKNIVILHTVEPFYFKVKILKDGDNFYATKSEFKPIRISDKNLERIDNEIEALSNYIGEKGFESRFIPVIASELVPRLGDVPVVDISEPKYQIDFDTLSTQSPNSDNIRDYLWMMREREISVRVFEKPFTVLESIIKDAFPRISSIDSGIKQKNRKTRFLIEKEGQYFELIQQGDGL